MIMLLPLINMVTIKSCDAFSKGVYRINQSKLQISRYVGFQGAGREKEVGNAFQSFGAEFWKALSP